MSTSADSLEAFLAARDETTFRPLYRQVTPLLFGLALRLTSGASADAEDIVQEAWIRALERLDRFEKRSSFRTWLCGFVVNCYREQARCRARGPRPLDESDDVRAALKVVALRDRSRRPERLDLERAIARLADGYREIVILHDLYGYTHREISELLGTEEGTSKSQLARGRERLRELLRADSARGGEGGRR